MTVSGGAMTIQHGAGVAIAPPLIMAATGFSDRQVLAVLAVALFVGIYRVTLADPPMAMRLAVVTTVTGFAVTVCMSPIFGRFLASRFDLTVPEGTIIAAFIIAVGWTKAYKMVENSLVDTILKAIVRGVKAVFGGK